MTQIINGKEIAQEIISELKQKPRPDKILAAIFVGASRASESFLRQKSKLAGELGIEFKIYQFAEDIPEEALKSNIKSIGDDEMVGGMIVQLPLPPRFNRDNILSALNPAKDLDGLLGKTKPLAVRVVETVLAKARLDIREKIVAVVGKGLLVGKPVADWLRGKCREIMVFDSKSDLNQIKKADLIITGVGKAGLIKPPMLKPGAGVIDFGFDVASGKIKGDLDNSSFSSSSLLAFYTPTPGGTGPILVAELLRSFYQLADENSNI